MTIWQRITDKEKEITPSPNLDGRPSEYTVIDPFDIYVDPTCTHLYRRWWHKIMFWRKFKYAEDAIVSAQRVSINTLKRKR